MPHSIVPFAAMNRIAVHLLCVIALPHLSAQEISWPTTAWSPASPEDRESRAAPIHELHQRIADGDFGYIDRLLVIANGGLVVDFKYPHDYSTISAGKDLTPHQYNYFHPDWHPFFNGRQVHTLQSVTKSITSAAIGIAIGKGEINGVDAPLLSFLEDYDLSRVDPRLKKATLGDLLTMRTGIEWHEQDRPLDETNTTVQLEASHDWVQFTLDQPMDAAPGEVWTYNSGGSQLMSAVIKDATGMNVDEYLDRHLFQPLGIQDYHWKQTPTGLPDTEGGLYLEADQLAKIGLLYLRGGRWENQQILPQDWVESSVARHVNQVGPGDWGYGYQWWRLDHDGTEIWAGLGYGGQYLLVMPQYDLIGVVNSWNIFDRPRGNILAAFREALIAMGKAAEQ